MQHSIGMKEAEPSQRKIDETKVMMASSLGEQYRWKPLIYVKITKYMGG